MKLQCRGLSHTVSLRSIPCRRHARSAVKRWVALLIMHHHHVTHSAGGCSNSIPSRTHLADAELPPPRPTRRGVGGGQASGTKACWISGASCAREQCCSVGWPRPLLCRRRIAKKSTLQPRKIGRTWVVRALGGIEHACLWQRNTYWE